MENNCFDVEFSLMYHMNLKKMEIAKCIVNKVSERQVRVLLENTMLCLSLDGLMQTNWFALVVKNNKKNELHVL